MSVQTEWAVLGIESSCDDSAAAVLSGRPAHARVLATKVKGQANLHEAFGGVVPEIAARAHAERLDYLVEDALAQAQLTLDDIDAIAVTAGPGLIGGVLSGVMLAKGLAAARGLPLIGVNHLAGHALTPRLTDGVGFPYLMLLVSGGHCQHLRITGPTEFQRLGGTIDDAPGEAFDKAARSLGLPQPGGPAIEALATTGDPDRFAFPRPLKGQPGCDMSFSGLKTALIRARDVCVSANGGLSARDQADLAAGFQAAIADSLISRSRAAITLAGPIESFSVAGGVAANGVIRAGLKQLADEAGLDFIAPPLALCTDNAAMIAYAGLERLAIGECDDLRLSARPRWPLDAQSPALLGSGRKGAKA